ncbi:hypothetical protein E2C01_063707 [Portunus trituberculatus]|uniref:Uncharacterized protein n=1 Tax=Portunus trituberculatus TaxID=210409 RepID=A0A5B7HEE1_PORTR|nr:hypothetical protein [Portunus trituberculatus]
MVTHIIVSLRQDPFAGTTSLLLINLMKQSHNHTFFTVFGELEKFLTMTSTSAGLTFNFTG